MSRYIKHVRTILAPVARDFYKRHAIGSLLADPVSNPKVAKSLGYGFSTAPLHLAPANLSGFQVCPKATEGCKAACLHTAGNPAYMAAKARARNNRTRAYFTDRGAFMQTLAYEVAGHYLKTRKTRGLVCAVRLNATSDIPWENVPLTIEGTVWPNVMTLFPKVVWYDYTKRCNRRNLPANYSLTFSLAENNDQDALRALVNGHNVAAVFSVRRGQPLPASYVIQGYTYPVIDGDEHDFRPADPKGVIVGLRAKGRAIGDASGFVRGPLTVDYASSKIYQQA